MRLSLFDTMDDTISLLEQRRTYYNECAYDLQHVIKDALQSDALLGVHVRVKSAKSLREKILRKRIYLQHNNQYDILSNLPDLIGLRAECRFMREEVDLYHTLCAACTMPHGDGTFSPPSQPNIRFFLSMEQPQEQQNGLSIYRIDGKYHKNGVTAPFELQIKSLVHVFWAEVEHQLIYKNNSYVLMDDFIKELLYTNYDSLRQIDRNLQLLYDHMQVSGAPIPSIQYAHMRPILAKVLSDVFVRHMHGQLGFSLRLNNACNVLAEYLLSRSVEAGNPINELLAHIRAASSKQICFDEVLELEGNYQSEDPLHASIGAHFSQQLNKNYDWNIFFRMLFSLEEDSNLNTFATFIHIYCGRFQKQELYCALPESRREEVKEKILCELTSVLSSIHDISVLFDGAICRLEKAIQDICLEGCEESDVIRLCLHCAADPSS